MDIASVGRFAFPVVLRERTTGSLPQVAPSVAALVGFALARPSTDDRWSCDRDCCRSAAASQRAAPLLECLAAPQSTTVHPATLGRSSARHTASLLEWGSKTALPVR